MSNSKRNFKNGKDAFSKKSASKGSFNKKGAKRGPRKDNKDYDAYNNPDANDIRWYASDPNTLKAATSIFFNRPVGTGNPFYSIENATMLEPFSRLVCEVKGIPGVMALKWNPTFGAAEDNTSPINRAAATIMTNIRRVNGGTSYFEKEDLMVHMICMDSLYYMWNLGVTAYGVLKSFSINSYYKPEVITKALGFDYEDLVANGVQLNWFLNHIRTAINANYVPNIFPIFERHSYLSSNIFMDSDDPKAQLYVFSPSGYYMFDETTYESGGAAKYHLLTPNMTVSKYMEVMTNMLNAIVDSTAAQSVGSIMAGALLKTYGDNAKFTLGSIAMDFETKPIYVNEMNMQIHNAITSPVIVDAYYQDQDKGCLVHSVSTHTTTVADTILTAIKPNLNLPMEHPDGDVIMTSTRLIPTFKTGSDGKIALNSIPTELISSFEIYYFNYQDTEDGTVTNQSLKVEIVSSVMDLTGASAINTFETISNFMAFDWAPKLYAGNKVVDGIILKAITPIYDAANLAFLSQENMYSLHTTALYSELGIPGSV